MFSTLKVNQRVNSKIMTRFPHREDGEHSRFFFKSKLKREKRPRFCTLKVTENTVIGFVHLNSSQVLYTYREHSNWFFKIVTGYVHVKTGITQSQVLYFQRQIEQSHWFFKLNSRENTITDSVHLKEQSC